jgi:hypothetical protein
MRVAALAGDRVDRLHVVRAHLVEQLVRQRDDVVFAHAGFQLLVDHVVDAIDHAGRLRQKLDLVPVLDLARAQHDLLAVDDLDAFFLQRVEHRGFGIVDAHRHVGHARVLDQLRDHLGVFASSGRIRAGSCRACRRRRPGSDRVQPVGIALVVHGGRAEIPDIGAVVTGQQAEAAHLVPLPFADLGGRDVADVVHVEEQERARPARPAALAASRQAVAAQAVMVDPAFEIDRGMAPGGDAVPPFPVRVPGPAGSAWFGIRARDMTELLRARHAPRFSGKGGSAVYWMHQPPSMWIIWPVM